MNVSTTTCTGEEVMECITVYSDLPTGGDMLIFSGILLVFFLLFAKIVIGSALLTPLHRYFLGNNSKEGKEIKQI